MLEERKKHTQLDLYEWFFVKTQVAVYGGLDW